MAALYDFLNRRDSWANWQNNNIILPDGVLAVITDSPSDELWLLMGDGTTHVRDLKVWKLYQDTVRESQPATLSQLTLSQLTLKSDGVHDPLTVEGVDGVSVGSIDKDGYTYIGKASTIMAEDGDQMILSNVGYLGGAQARGGVNLDKVSGLFGMVDENGNGINVTGITMLEFDGAANMNLPSTGLNVNGGPLTSNGKFTSNGGAQIDGNTTIYGDTSVYGEVASVAPSSLATMRGPSSSRPAQMMDNVPVIPGYQYFDTTLGKPVWVKSNVSGTVTWVDSTGAVV